jgi:hypothetical protein
MLENLDPTVEQVKQLISELTEEPMNKSLLVLKQKNMLEEAAMAGMKTNTSKTELDRVERQILRPMYVLSVSKDSDSGVKPLDMVRASRLTELTGVQMPCSIDGYKIIVVRDYDLLTVIRK